MKPHVTRRNFLATAGGAALAATAPAAFAAPAAGPAAPIKLLGVACSPRPGMTTAKAVQAALDAARAVDGRIQTELIDLGGLKIAPWSPKPPEDDMKDILPKLQDPAVAGLILGSPSYFRAMSALCKAFIERCAPLREPDMVLAGKPVGAVAVGAFRNGGQELVIEQIHTAMLCFGMIPVGGHPPAFQGATLLSVKDSIAQDDLGLKTAAQLGKRIGELALTKTP
ncbi:MAG: flavodoxin family protein [Verrucomicrobia bacterium]|nr:flavodoxin family protein [Verrucomicrobiota bacterium]